MPLCCQFAWEGQILTFTSPDTGQDRWNFADGDLRAPMIVLARKAWIFIDA